MAQSDVAVPRSVTAQNTAPVGQGGGAGPVLEVRDLRATFATNRGDIRALDGVSISLLPGETLGIVGESGSGKTVFARSIAGLLPPRGVKREGEILFQGRDLLKLDEHELRRVLGAEIAMIFQDPMTALNPVMRVGAQVVEELRLREKLNRREARDAAIALLRSVHIPAPESVVRRYPHELSGGMRQRIVIAIAISCGPQILLADEPTTALDVTVQAQILDLLAEKQRETNAATILVTHDLGVVANRTDRTAVMYAGKIVEIGPTASLFQDTRMPYTEALLKSIPRMDTPTRSRLQAIGGRPPDLAKPREGCRFAERCPYVRDRCRVEEPTLQPTATPEHQFACWYPVGLNRIEPAVAQRGSVEGAS